MEGDRLEKHLHPQASLAPPSEPASIKGSLVLGAALQPNGQAQGGPHPAADSSSPILGPGRAQPGSPLLPGPLVASPLQTVHGGAAGRDASAPWPGSLSGDHPAADLHMSGSEPRIFPGMLSRRVRAASIKTGASEGGSTVDGTVAGKES
jgi:hypothetical protein